jgi:alkanesulfonate monooxygenase SsuD/methylene tetrahydromethanopterin reductase-like flavin-dependent oxidoreductase (luciferase family)
LDFGIFNVMQQRRRSKPSLQILKEAVEQTRVAEQLGFSTNWYAEHHFSNYSLCPSPLMMAAHCAGMTTKIRLGTAVVVAPLYAPARLLAEIAMVDEMSNGRLELGIGSGYQAYEFDRFGADLANSKERTMEIVDLIERGLTEDVFAYDGTFYKQPKTAISIRPVQKPHPPIWFASNDPTFIRRAVASGYTIFTSGLLGSNNRLARTREFMDSVVKEAGHDPAKLRVAVLRFAFVTDDKKEAQHYTDCARYQQRLAVSLKSRKETVVDNYMIEEKAYDEELPWEVIERNLPVGDVETCASRMADIIRRVRPVHIAIQPQLGDIEHKASLRSMERWAAEVIPAIEKELGRPLAEVNRPAVAAAE